MRAIRSKSLACAFAALVSLVSVWWVGRAAAGEPLRTSASLVQVEPPAGVEVAAGGSVEGEIRLRIAEGWHLQAAVVSQDYLIPTRLTLETAEGIEVGPVRYPTPKRMDFLGEPIEVIEGEVVLRFRVAASRRAAPGLRQLRGQLTVQACDDKTCLAPSTLSVTVPVSVTAPGGGAVPSGPEAPARPRWLPAVRSLGKALLGALVGGLILNLMPCVLPVIAIKILGFVQQAGERPVVVKRLGLVFGLGVLVSFWVLALLVIVLQAAGHQLGWGFQFQDARFILVMAVVVTVIALNFFGVFEIELAAPLLNRAGALASRSGTAGAFFSGVLATALATPCTAPFLGAALGFAFTQPPAGILAIFTAVAVGLALPYVVLSWNPALLRWVPKPGPWLLRFRQAMGFPMLATALWLVWILAGPYGARAALAVAAWLLGLAFAVWLTAALRPGRVGWVLAVLLVVGAVGYRFVAPLLKESSREDSSRRKSSLIVWQPYTKATLEEALRTPRPVFVDFTADWCLTCQMNKRTSLEVASVAQRFRELEVIPLLADWTRPNPEITEALRGFGRSGVPLYVVYPADRSRPPLVLPEVLTPQIVLEALERAVAK